jgi:predicted dehydrogenase
MTPTQRKVRYVVVGAGNIAQVAVLPAFAHAGENSELVGIVSSDTEKRGVLAQRYGVTHLAGYDGLERLLAESRADAVYIAVPNSMHRELTERAARVGVHVLCEKPMAETIDDCLAMINVCKEHDVRLMIAYRLHFEPATLSAIALAQSGKLGDLRLFSSVFSQDVRAGDVRTQGELAGGALYDMGVYPINAVRNLFRDEPVEVLASCQTGDERFHEVDATTTAILRFPEGRVAQLTASLTAASVSTYRLVGTKGDLWVEPAFDYSRALRHQVTLGGETTTHTFPLGDQFAPEIVYFSSCVLDGREPEPSGEEGLADVRIVRAIFRSAETGKAVVLTPYSRSHRPGITQAMHAPPVAEVTPFNAPSPTGS